MKALTFSAFGGSDVLEYREVADPEPRPGSLLVRMRAIGLNFADIYRRRGNYHLKGAPPFIAGYEGAGVVEDAGGEAEFRNGDRVGFADVPFANAELVLVPAAHAIPLPGWVSFETAAALLLQGLTAHYLATDSHPTRPGEIALVHAAAGGVGQLLTRISTLLGARVIGLTSSEEKAAFARAQGAAAVFLYANDWKARVRELAPDGVDVAYDSVGSTLRDSLDVTRFRGQVVFYGMAGGDPDPVDPRVLMDASKTLTGGDLWNYLTSREERIRRAERLFEWLRAGDLAPPHPTCFPLAEGRRAHELLESRRSAGKIVLIPGRQDDPVPFS